MKFFIVIKFLSTKKSHPESQCIRRNTFGVIKDGQVLPRACLSLSLDEHKKQQKIQSPWLFYEPLWDHWGAVSTLYFEKLYIKTQSSASGREADMQCVYPLADIKDSHVGFKRAPCPWTPISLSIVFLPFTDHSTSFKIHGIPLIYTNKFDFNQVWGKDSGLVDLPSLHHFTQAQKLKLNNWHIALILPNHQLPQYQRSCLKLFFKGDRFQ